MTAGTAIDPGLTCVDVEQRDGRPRVSSRNGLLRAQVVHASGGWCRIGLLATTALLLGGDAVELRVCVGPGARLHLFDVAGTVAFDGRGAPARWSTSVTVHAGAVFRWSGQPLVVADGADVTRTFELDVAGTGRALVRDTVVLGRSGETGGRLRSRTTIRCADRLVALEGQDLEPELRRLPGVLGDLRVLDTITAVSRAESRPSRPADEHVSRFALTGGGGTVTRYLGRQLALSPLHQEWQDLQDD
ncbi:MAG TPA: urease accessory protein UreD [Propionibacteriaceae bacterium]